MPTILKCFYCREIPEVNKVFHLKGKTRIFWNIGFLGTVITFSYILCLFPEAL